MNTERMKQQCRDAIRNAPGHPDTAVVVFQKKVHRNPGNRTTLRLWQGGPSARVVGMQRKDIVILMANAQEVLDALDKLDIPVVGGIEQEPTP